MLRTTATPSSSVWSCSCSRSCTSPPSRVARGRRSARASRRRLAAGVNITLYKLWAFALASFVTGVAGCLLAAQVGVPRAITFQTQDSLTLAAAAMIGGIFSLWGAVVAGIFQQLVPFLFQAQWGINSNLVLILFGAGLLQVLLTAPGGLVAAAPERPWQPRAGSQSGACVRWRPARSLRHDRGAGPDRPLRRCDADRRHERRLPGRRLRTDRPERRRQDDVLQRPQRLRQSCGRIDRGLRREPAEAGRLQACALGASPHVPDGDGDREAVGLRQRRDDPRAFGSEAFDASRGCARRDRFRRAGGHAEDESRRARRARAAARRGRARGGREARGSSCSTSPRRVFPTRRRRSSAR